MRHTANNVVAALCLVVGIVLPNTCKSIERPYSEIEQHFNVVQVTGSTLIAGFGPGYKVIFQTDGKCDTYQGAAGIMNIGPTWGYLLFDGKRCNIFSINAFH